MRKRCLGLVVGAVMVSAALAADGGRYALAQDGGGAPAAGQPGQPGQDGGGGGRGGRGFGGPGGTRGTIGTVTAVAADNYMIKTEDGTVFTVHFSVNTRIVKGGGGGGPRRQGGGGGQGGGQGSGGGGERAQPTPIKATDIKVGDVITAGGEMDEAAKSIGAVFIAQVDPERVKQMKEMQANYGKTWLAGRVTGIEGTTITIDGMMDHAKHTIEVDENTSFHKRRDAVTLGDIQPGMQLRAEGGVQGAGFRATSVTASEPRGEGGRGGGPGGPPPGAPPPSE